MSNIKEVYKKCLHAMRLNGERFGHWETCFYWMGKSPELTAKVYESLTAEPDHLKIKALRLNSGGQLHVFKNKLIVR